VFWAVVIIIVDMNETTSLQTKHKCSHLLW